MNSPKVTEPGKGGSGRQVFACNGTEATKGVPFPLYVTHREPDPDPWHLQSSMLNHGVSISQVL